MFRHNFSAAARELRFHPSRVIATLVAIAISVGFMAGVSIFLQSQRATMGKQLALPTTVADLKISFIPNEAATEENITNALRQTAGVADYSALHIRHLVLKSAEGKTQIANTYALTKAGFRWSEITEGAWPKSPDEIALSPSLADELAVKVADELTYGDDEKLKVSGITNDLPGLFFKPAYRPQTGFNLSSDILVKVAAGADPAAVATELQNRFKPYAMADGPEPLKVLTSQQAQSDALKSLSGDFDALRNVLLVFAAIALLVGMIIIANTFTILLAQRRRQIGLLRAVGATSGQVRRRYLAEAALLGLVGSSLGICLGTVISAGGSWLTKTLAWGISIPWNEVLIELLVGIAITLIAAMVPVLHTAKVRPLEALSPVPTHEAERRGKKLRAAICILFALGAAALIVGALNVDSLSLPLAVGGATTLTIAVLVGSQLYIPTVIRLLGALLRRRPVGNLAVENTLRNPARASATATALMLAIGLIVTLQVGTATAERTMTKAIDEKNPVDLSITSTVSFTESLPTANPIAQNILDELDGVPNVAARATLNGVGATAADENIWSVLAWNPQVGNTINGSATAPADDVALVSDTNQLSNITLTGPSGNVTLKLEKSKYPQDYDQVVVSETTLKKLGTGTPMAVWIKLADRNNVAQSVDSIEAITHSDASLITSGSAFQAMILDKALSTILLTVTALLAVAVVIALIGVGNTLTLSVIERQRETALLRALGMQRGAIRLMLLLEAVLIAVSAALVAIGFGVFFGWLGVTSLITQIQHETGEVLETSFAIDLPQTLGMLALTLLAAGLASILPGRRAVHASPTQALAEE